MNATSTLSLLLFALPVAAADFFFKDGDKVVMIGDRIPALLYVCFHLPCLVER